MADKKKNIPTSDDGQLEVVYQSNRNGGGIAKFQLNVNEMHPKTRGNVKIHAEITVEMNGKSKWKSPDATEPIDELIDAIEKATADIIRISLDPKGEPGNNIAQNVISIDEEKKKEINIILMLPELVVTESHDPIAVPEAMEFDEKAIGKIYLWTLHYYSV